MQSKNIDCVGLVVMATLIAITRTNMLNITTLVSIPSMEWWHDGEIGNRSSAIVSWIGKWILLAKTNRKSGENRLKIHSCHSSRFSLQFSVEKNLLCIIVYNINYNKFTRSNFFFHFFINTFSRATCMMHWYNCCGIILYIHICIV